MYPDSLNIATRRAFDTTPDTVYGILVFCLAAAVVGLWIAYVLQTRSYVSKLIELNKDTVQALQAVNASLQLFKEMREVAVMQVKEHVNNSIERLEDLIRSDDKIQRNENNTKAAGRPAAGVGAPPGA